MSFLSRLFPQGIEKLKKGINAALCDNYNYPKMECLVSAFLKTASPEQVMEVYWMSVERPLAKEFTSASKEDIKASVKALGPAGVEALLKRFDDPDESWGSPKYFAITTLGEIGAMTAFRPILDIAMKDSLRDATHPALGNLRLADPARWKELTLACTAKEQAYLSGAGAMSRGSSYERMTNKTWHEDYYLPGEGP